MRHGKRRSRAGGETPGIGKGGACDIGSEPFRKACALLPDGKVLPVTPCLTAEGEGGTT